ncbi:MAG TPA: spore coat U domain-containing protein [Vicinamibacterales bacterium]|nr:spore coat U domain-containing protein [Vicinamibacterales bacterium]
MLVLSAARLEAACTVSATGVSFGSYDILSPTPDDSTGSIVILCSPGDKNIQVSLSTGSSGTYTARTLVNGSDVLLYNLYSDAARTVVWGDGTGGTSVLLIPNWTGGRKPKTYVIYGRMPAQQNAAAGTYADSIVVTVDF